MESTSGTKYRHGTVPFLGITYSKIFFVNLNTCIIEKKSLSLNFERIRFFKTMRYLGIRFDHAMRKLQQIKQALGKDSYDPKQGKGRLFVVVTKEIALFRVPVWTGPTRLGNW